MPLNRYLPYLVLLGLIVSRAPADARAGRVVVLVAGSCSVRDFAELLNRGSAGLLNVRAGRPSHELQPGSRSGFEAGCLSLGASAMATGGAEVRRAGDVDGVIDGYNVKDAYEYRTGIKCGRAMILHPEIALIRRVNEESWYRAKPGALGSALRKAGIRTAVIGCSDIPNEVHREAVTVAMDDWGRVDCGEVDGSRLLRRNPLAPFGVETNRAALLAVYDALPADCRFVVVDFGDTFRADAYCELCTDERAAAVKNAADGRLAAFAGELARRLDLRRDLLLVLSPNPRSFSEIEGERMGAIVVCGPGFSAGLLTSPSTRKVGVVTLGDVAPTALTFLGIEPGPEMVGRPMRSVPLRQVRGGRDCATVLLAMNAEASAQARRQVIMRGASIAQSVLVVLVVGATLLAGSAAIRRLAAWLVLSFPAIPLAMLAMPMICSVGLVGSIAVLVGLVLAIIGCCAVVFRSPGRAFVWLCGAILVGLMVDLLRGAPLIDASIAGYNIVEGARYYGIGNELMGTMLGAAIVGVGMALAPFDRLATPGSRWRTGAVATAILAAVFVLIGAPFLGANVGGALAAAPAIAVMLLARRGWRPSWRGIAFIGLLTVAVVGALFVADAVRGGAAATHAGRTLSMVKAGQASGLFALAERKLALNSMLIATSVWSRLLGLCLAGSAVLAWWGRRERGADMLGRDENAAGMGCAVGTIGALVFNDSGVVAGATCAVFLFALLAIKVLETHFQAKPQS